MLELVALSGLGAGALALTPAELFVAVDARYKYEQDLEWNHTAAILSMMHNMVSKKPKDPTEFHPFHKGKVKSKTKVGLADFKAILKRPEKSSTKSSTKEK